MSKQTQNQTAAANANTNVEGENMPQVTLSSLIVGAATLADFKEALTKQPQAIQALPANIQLRAQIEGIYRQFSAETAGKGDKVMSEAATIAARLERGYWSLRDEKAATQAVTTTKGKAAAKYTRTEILGAIRDNTPKAKLSNLKTLESWDDDKLLAFFTTQSQKEGSAVYKARIQLEEAAAAKAKAELDKMLGEFETIDL